MLGTCKARQFVSIIVQCRSKALMTREIFPREQTNKSLQLDEAFCWLVALYSSGRKRRHDGGSAEAGWKRTKGNGTHRAAERMEENKRAFSSDAVPGGECGENPDCHVLRPCLHVVRRHLKSETCPKLRSWASLAEARNLKLILTGLGRHWLGTAASETMKLRTTVAMRQIAKKDVEDGEEANGVIERRTIPSWCARPAQRSTSETTASHYE
jgi:hypothetical protein